MTRVCVVHVLRHGAYISKQVVPPVGGHVHGRQLPPARLDSGGRLPLLMVPERRRQRRHGVAALGDALLLLRAQGLAAAHPPEQAAAAVEGERVGGVEAVGGEALGPVGTLEEGEPRGLGFGFGFGFGLG